MNEGSILLIKADTVLAVFAGGNAQDMLGRMEYICSNKYSQTVLQFTAQECKAIDI